MKGLAVAFCSLILGLSSCSYYGNPEACATFPDGHSNFKLEVVDMGDFLSLSLRNISQEEIGKTAPLEYLTVVKNRKNRGSSVICLEDIGVPNVNVFTHVKPGSSLETKLKKETALEELAEVKSTKNFRFLYNAAYSGVCTLDANSKITCD